MTNDMELVSALARGLGQRPPSGRGRFVRLVVLEHMPLVEQVEAIAKAACLLAASGSSLTWLILMEKCSTVVELGLVAFRDHSEPVDFHLWSRWAAVVGVRYTGLTRMGNVYSENFTVDIPRTVGAVHMAERYFYNCVSQRFQAQP
jgi:hypothetical protein